MTPELQNYHKCLLSCKVGDRVWLYCGPCWASETGRKPHCLVPTPNIGAINTELVECEVIGYSETSQFYQGSLPGVPLIRSVEDRRTTIGKSALVGTKYRVARILKNRQASQ